MRTSENINELATALAKAQGQFENAKKDSKNDFFKSQYADLAACIDASRGPLAANGLAVVQAPSFVAEGDYVRMTTRILHTSGQWMESDIDALPKDKGPQSIGGVVTYLRRYALCAMIGLAAEDDDANAGQGAEQKEKITRNARGWAKNDIKPAEKKQPSKATYDAAMAKILTWKGDANQWTKFRGEVFNGLVKLEGDGEITADQAHALEKAMDARDKEFPQPQEEVSAA